MSKNSNYSAIILYNFRQLSDYAVVLCHNVGHIFQITIPIHTMHRLKHFRRCIFILCMESLSTGYAHCTRDVHSVWTTYFSFFIVSFTQHLFSVVYLRRTKEHSKLIFVQTE